MIKKLKRYWFRLTHPVIGEVWQLHRVTNEHSLQERMWQYEITPKRLESLIVEYQTMGYEFITIAEVAERMKGKKGKKFIAVTLDDGYADNFELAYLMFKKYNVPFCIYVCEGMLTDKIEEDNIEHYRMMSVEQLKSLDKEPLCTIGSHTQSHVHLTQFTREQQTKEILHCKLWLEQLLMHPIEDFAFPYGDYNSVSLSILSECGITRSVAAWGGAVRKNTPESILTIPRELVTETDKK